jgi:hypothetical protein
MEETVRRTLERSGVREGEEFVPAQAVDLLFRLVGPLAGVGCFLRLLFWLFWS